MKQLCLVTSLKQTSLIARIDMLYNYLACLSLQGAFIMCMFQCRYILYNNTAMFIYYLLFLLINKVLITRKQRKILICNYCYILFVLYIFNKQVLIWNKSLSSTVYITGCNGLVSSLQEGRNITAGYSRTTPWTVMCRPPDGSTPHAEYSPAGNAGPAILISCQ